MAWTGPSPWLQRRFSASAPRSAPRSPRPGDAAEALRAHLETEHTGPPPVLVAWDGALARPAPSPRRLSPMPNFVSRTGSRPGPEGSGWGGGHGPSPPIRLPPPHRRGRGSDRDVHGDLGAAVRVAATGVGPELGARHAARRASLGAQSLARRSQRSRGLCRWVGSTVATWSRSSRLLPTFNDAAGRAQPVLPVSRLFWSELVLDLGDAHRRTEPRTPWM